MGSPHQSGWHDVGPGAVMAPGRWGLDRPVAGDDPVGVDGGVVGGVDQDRPGLSSGWAGPRLEGMSSEVEAVLRRVWVPTAGELAAVVEGRQPPARARLDIEVPTEQTRDESHGV